MSILSEIGAFLLGIGSETLHFIRGLVTILAQNPQLQAIAQQEVQNVEAAAITAAVSGSITTGVEKLASAQIAIVGQLKAQGLPIVMNAVNLAIEGAVANMKTTVAPVS